MRKNGSPEAVFETDEDKTYFLLIFRPHPDFPVKSATTDQVTDQVTLVLKSLAEKEMPTNEIMNKIGIKHRATFRNNYLSPAIANNLIEMTIPEKSRSPKQKYRLTELGRRVLEIIKSK